jgi:predicted small lipoprotein YifL
MTPTMRALFLKFAPIIAITTTISACGDDGPKLPPAERGIVTSAFECPELLKVEAADCDKAIEIAKARHEKSSTTYRSNAKCEAAEGKDHCERSGDKDFSRRLQAFLITASKKPQAAPLYPTKDGTPGFAEGNGANISTESEKIKFSEEAFALALLNEGGGQPASGGF